MQDLIGTAEIAQILGLSREYVTDVVVKRPDFPKPEIAMTRRTKRWSERTIRDYLRNVGSKK